jgi:AraC family transcriptional regulator
MTGEPLNQFIQRLRIEKAARQLSDNPKKSITVIALDCGFSGSAPFARAFKDYFCMSASEWRKQINEKSKIGKPKSKNSQTNSKTGKASGWKDDYIKGVTFNITRRKNMKSKSTLQVQVRELPDRPVAYVRHIGPYKGDDKLFRGLFHQLMSWAGPRDLLKFPETQILIVYHDNPEITEDQKLRTSVCITVPPETKTDGVIGSMTVPAGKYACARFELLPHEYQQAWDTLCGEWLPDSGYQPDDRPCFEWCLNNPDEHPEHKHIVDICIPVRPL